MVLLLNIGYGVITHYRVWCYYSLLGMVLLLTIGYGVITHHRVWCYYSL